MKTYDEMTNSVMEKVQEHRAAQRRKKNRMIVSAVCICSLVLIVTLVSKTAQSAEPAVQICNPTNATYFQKPTNSLPPESTENQLNSSVKPRITLLCATSNGEVVQELRENVKIPYAAQLRVRNVSGMSEEERKQVIDEEDAYVREFEEKFGQNSGYGRYCRENVIVTRISAGEFSLEFEDIETVDRIQISVTENGYIFFPRFSGIRFTEFGENGYTVEVDGDKLRKGLAMLNTDAFKMIWHFNPSVAEVLNEDPDMELAQLSDRVTIAVAYSDGKTETKTMIVQVGDDGQILTYLLDGTVADQIPS